MNEIDHWAAQRVVEYNYRRMFHLSKFEMANEPIEDVELNLEIQRLKRRKRDQQRAIMESMQKAKMRT